MRPTYHSINQDNGYEIGWITDGEEIFLAVPLAQRDQRIGLFFPKDLVETMGAFYPGASAKFRLFSTVQYTDEIHARLKEFIDHLISAIYALPQYTQLEMNLDLEGWELARKADIGD